MSRGGLLAPLAAAYGVGVAARLSLFRAGLLRVHRAPRPVVSVGNVAAGGAGKTPFVRWLAGELLERGISPGILTRGYGRTSRGLVVVSDGAGRLSSVEASGDEPAVLARALPKVAVVADASRLRAAQRLLEIAPHTAVLLLDDGFSHVALARDADIVLLDATEPDAGGALLPAGRLREPLAALARADVIVVTKTEQADPARAVALAGRHAPGIPLFRAVTEVTGLADGAGNAVRPEDLPGATVVAVAGLARPDAFAATLASLGIRPAAFLTFRDHARYGAAEVRRIVRAAEEAGATAVLTTEKDAVKLEGRSPLPLFSLGVRMRVVEPDFLNSLLARVARRPS